MYFNDIQKMHQRSTSRSYVATKIRKSICVRFILHVLHVIHFLRTMFVSTISFFSLIFAVAAKGTPDPFSECDTMKLD